ncbi:MAG: HAD family phosphatase [Candidatus Aenigmatarchaeota archaeon]|nr:HAD family phosphatase [Nanoarchaeota archaeon]
MKQAVIFDVDGIMVDTEQLAMNTAEKVMNDLGVVLSQEEKLMFVGVKAKQYFPELIRKKGLHLDPNKVLQKFYILYEKEHPTVPILPAIEECVKTLKPHYKLGVTSGSPFAHVNNVLKRIGVQNFFQTVVTWEDIGDNPQHYKPHPRMYQMATQRLGVDPNKCVAIEDTKSGVISAKNAGLAVIGVEIGSKGLQDLSDANKVVKTLNDVGLELIESI